MLLLKTRSVSFFYPCLFITGHILPITDWVTHAINSVLKRKRDVSIITVLLLFICIIITFIMVFTFERVVMYRNLAGLVLCA